MYRRVLLKSARIILPSMQARELELALEDRSILKLPTDNSSYLSKLRLRIDVAWMQLWHGRLAKWLVDGVVIYLLIDSSPQGL